MHIVGVVVIRNRNANNLNNDGVDLKTGYSEFVQLTK
jgi:hypothetical protein